MKAILASLLILSILSGAEITKFKTPSGSWDEAVAAARKEGGTIRLPRGEYKLSRTIEVPEDLTLLFEDGATVVSDVSPVIRHTGGTLTIEGVGRPGRIVCTRKGRRGFATTERAGVIDLNHTARGKSPARLVMRNMEVKGFNGIDGYHRVEGRGKVAAIDLSRCRFECVEKSVGLQLPELGECRIENSVFEGGDNPILINAPVPGGVIVRGNTLRNFGRTGMLIGKAGQVAEGCTAHVPSAIVHDNQLLGGGRGETINDSYTQGILIYGHNVSVQGNIVRDVNRGEAVPGASAGRQIKAPDGTLLRGKWIMVDGKQRRLAGAAIYLKANRAIVQGNVCTNSGWRSVIEIKTGGKEHFVSVVNNVVDGKALAIDESFGFECNSGRSLWANNVVYDMPHQAFVVRSGFENTFMNNLICNAKIGFALSGRTPGQDELIAGNRFIQVEHPVALDGKIQKEGTGTDVFLPPPARIADDAELPVPGAQWHGRQLVRGDRIYLGVRRNDEYRWMELDGKLLPVKRYRVFGPELALNPDQSGKEAPPSGLDNPLHPGWTLFMRSAGEKPIDPKDGHISFDTKNFKSGGRALKIAFVNVAGEWRLRQSLNLHPGRRYRATALVRGEEPRNLRLEVVHSNGFSEQRRGADTQDWQTLSVDFKTPAHSGAVTLSVWGSKTTAGKAAWLDSVSVRELEEESAEPRREYQPAGPELAAPFSGGKAGELPPRWSSSLPAGQLELKTGEKAVAELSRKGSAGNLLLSQNVKLEPGKRYRFETELKSGFPLRVIPGVKTADGKNFSGRVSASTQWQTVPVDFTVPDKEGAVALRIWGSGLKPGESFQIGKISLRRLE